MGTDQWTMNTALTGGCKSVDRHEEFREVFFSYVQFFCYYFTDEIYREMGPDEKLAAGESL